MSDTMHKERVYRVNAVTPLVHEDDITALCERMEDGELRDFDALTAAATIRSLCRQLDEARNFDQRKD